MIISILIIEISKKNKDFIIENVACVNYLSCFYKKNKKVELQVLIDLGINVNTHVLTYIAKIGLKICQTIIRAQKINGFILKIFYMVRLNFEIKNKLGKFRIFSETL